MNTEDTKMYSQLGKPFTKQCKPQQSSFICLSLKLGCIVTAFISTTYSVLGVTRAGISFASLVDDKEETSKVYLMSFLILSIISHGVTFVLSIFLLVGVLMDKLKFIRAWMIWFMLQTVVYVAFYVFLTTLQIVNNYDAGYLILYLTEFLILVIRIYMLIVVSSYYKQREEDGELTKLFENNECYYNSIL